MEQSSRASALRAEILAVAAGALLYEAAKQCVNAVANLRGSDPQDNRAKIDEISAVIAQGLTTFNLRVGSRAAWDLHIHADQGDLTTVDFRERFALAADFIDEMQAIYRSIAATA